MNKSELVEVAAQEAGITKTVAEKALNAVLDGITKALAEGDKVTFVGFGTFSTAKRPARKGRNPKTGKEINIPASVVPKFKPGKSLKEEVA